jgi:hypothetical protein
LVFNSPVKISSAKSRRDLLDLIIRGLEGAAVWILRKARRFRLARDQAPASRLSRITPLELVNPEGDSSGPTFQQDMQRAWEHDWSAL